MTPTPHRVYAAHIDALSHDAECREAAMGLARVLAALASARSGEPVDRVKVRRAADLMAIDLGLACPPALHLGVRAVRWG